MSKFDWQSQFSMSKIIGIFLSFFSLKNINLGTYFLWLTFFIASIYKSLYFLKWCPLFDSLSLNQFLKFNHFIWVCSDAASGWEFGSSVHPIPTRGADYTHHIAACPPRFENIAASLVCWFVGKNLSNFVSFTWKLDNPYWLNTNTKCVCLKEWRNGQFFGPKSGTGSDIC